MEHKLIVAQNLRKGLQKLKEIYTQAFYATTPFCEQWQCFVIKESFDVDWNQHHDIIERDFALSSRRLFNRIKGG